MTPTEERHLDADTIQQMLDAGVRRSVEYARRASPWYREKLSGVPPIQGIHELDRLPFTTKQDVSAAGRAFWAVGDHEIVDISTTSGTTGRPTLYPMTSADVDRLAENERLSFTAAGVGRQDRVILAVTLDRCFIAGLAYFEGLRALGAGVARVGSGSPAMLLELAERLEATTIVSVPSFLDRIATYARREQQPLPASVRRLVCIGEPVRDAALQHTPMADRVTRAWGAPLQATYGLTEAAASACECPQGAGGHLHPSLLHVEVVDDEGRPVPDGAPGEVVVTPIGVQAMPLLRYRTGDVAALYRSPCACGLQTPRLGPILGRKHQAMKLKGTSVYPAAVQAALDRVPDVRGYVIIARALDVLSDEIEVAVCVEGDTARAHRQLAERLQGALKVTPTIRIVSMSQLEELRGGGRKQRVFIDAR